MKGYFIVHEEFDKENLTGIQKKILSQINVFCHYGMNCKKYYISNGTERMGKIIAGGISLLPFGNRYPQWIIPDNIEDISYIYMRRPFCMNWAMRNWIKKVKKINKNLKIIVEIPTYPYDKEFNTITSKFFLIKDKYNRKKMKSLIDVFTVIGSNGKMQDLWGIPAIPFKNGVSVNNIKVCKKQYNNKEIHLMCIAMFVYWHGYDRLLEGMIRYYQNGGRVNVICHFVGEGRELKKYKKLAENSLIYDKVIFHGRMDGKRLDDLYDKIDVGICGLGAHRRNKTEEISSELKSREYIARGIPIVVSGRMDILEKKSLEFVHQFEANDDPLDVQSIIDFYKQVSNKKDFRVEIREFAKENVDMKITMKPVVEYIQSIISK